MILNSSFRYFRVLAAIIACVHHRVMYAIRYRIVYRRSRMEIERIWLDKVLCHL